MESAGMWPAKLLLPFYPRTKASLSPCWKPAHEMFPFCFLLYLEVYWTPLCCNITRMGLWSPLCQLDGSLQTAWTAMCKETNGMPPSWATCTAPNPLGDELGSFDAIYLKTVLQATWSPRLQGDLTEMLSFICNVQQALGSKGQDISLVEVMVGPGPQ